MPALHRTTLPALTALAVCGRAPVAGKTSAARPVYGDNPFGSA